MLMFNDQWGWWRESPSRRISSCSYCMATDATTCRSGIISLFCLAEFLADCGNCLAYPVVVCLCVCLSVWCCCVEDRAGFCCEGYHRELLLCARWGFRSAHGKGDLKASEVGCSFVRSLLRAGVHHTLDSSMETVCRFDALAQQREGELVDVCECMHDV